MPNNLPSVSVSSPSNNKTVNSNTSSIEVSGSASDSDGSVSRVEVKLNSGSWRTASGTTSWSYTVSGLQTGSNTIYVRSRDNNNAYSSEITRTVSREAPPNQAPSVSISSPSNNQSVSSSTSSIEVSGSASDGDGSVSRVEVKLNSGSWRTASGTSSWNYTVSGLQTGSNTIYVRSRDNNNTYSSEITRQVTRESPPNQAPSVSISSPSNNQSVSSSTSSITVSGNASDSDGSVNRVEVKLNSGSWRTASGTTSWSYTVSGLQTGSNTIYVRSRDNNNAYSSESARTVTRESAVEPNPDNPPQQPPTQPTNQRPIVNISSPANNHTVSTNSVKITGNASDADGTVDRVEARLNSGNWIAASGIENWSITLSDLQTGSNTITVRALDNKNVSSTEQTTNVRFAVEQNQRPAINIDTPTNNHTVENQRTSVTVTGTAQDTDGSIGKVEVRLNSDAWVQASGTAVWSLTVNDLSVGNNTIRVRATDNADATSTEKSVTVIRNAVQNKIPVVSISNPANQHSVDSTIDNVTVEGTASDSDGSVWRVHIQLNGQGWRTVSGTTQWSYTMTGLKTGDNLIEARATDNSGVFSTTRAVTVIRKAAITPSAPANVNGTDGTSTSYVRVNWSKVADAEYYRLYVCEQSNSIPGCSILATRLTESFFDHREADVEKTYYYRVQACSTNCSALSDSGSGFKKARGPIVSITGGNQSLEDSDSESGELISLSASAEPGDSEVVATAWYVNGLKITEGHTLSNLRLPDGATIIDFIATDERDNTSKDSAIILILSPLNQRPELTITFPTQTIELSADVESFAVTGTAADKDGIISLVEGNLNDTGWQSATGRSQWSLDLSELRTGDNHIQLRATDNTGAISAVKSLTIHRKPPNQRPTLSVTKPVGNSVIELTEQSIVIEGSAHDTDGDVEAIWVSINQSEPILASGTDKWTASLNGLNENLNKVSVTAQDNQGANSAPAILTFKVNLPRQPKGPMLEVRSVGANSVSIASNFDEFKGVTPYDAVMTDDQLISLTAPTIAGSTRFLGWLGCDTVARSICLVDPKAQKLVRAIYKPEISEHIPTRQTVTESGKPTVAMIRGGITLQNTNTQVESIIAPTHVKLEIAIEPELDHVGKRGYIYLFAMINGHPHYVDGLGRILPYSNPQDVEHFYIYETLEAANVITVFDGVLAESDRGLLELVVAYAVSDEPEELYRNEEFIRLEIK